MPVAVLGGREVRVARTRRARLLGLAYLSRDESGPGLLIPRCSSVHTFGMRFRLDVYFLDAAGTAISVCRGVPTRRVVSHRGAKAVLEIPAAEGGEFSPLCP
ncbi:MAG TPA: DUF192 domain-containing protein [Solirubrobacterales bacterium]|nr:DUF192 domain-containing protein [Solirubrobacterales bacterium]